MPQATREAIALRNRLMTLLFERERMEKLLERYPLPRPRIMVTFHAA